MLPYSPARMLLHRLAAVTRLSFRLFRDMFSQAEEQWTHKSCVALNYLSIISCPWLKASHENAQPVVPSQVFSLVQLHMDHESYATSQYSIPWCFPTPVLLNIYKLVALTISSQHLEASVDLASFIYIYSTLKVKEPGHTLYWPLPLWCTLSKLPLYCWLGTYRHEGKSDTPIHGSVQFYTSDDQFYFYTSDAMARYPTAWPNTSRRADWRWSIGAFLQLLPKGACSKETIAGLSML